MSHVSTTAPTTTHPITVVSSGLSSVSSVSVAPSLTGFPVSHGVVPPPHLDTEELWRCFWLCFCAAAADSIFNAFSGLCQLCYGFFTGRFFSFFRVEPPTVLYLIYVWCLFWCLLFILGAKLDAVFTYGGSTVRVCTLVTLWSVPMAGICATW